MDKGLYRDLSDKYINLIVSDMDDLIEEINTDEAHKPQFDFRFNLFKKNVDSFESLINQTSTVIDSGQYTNLRLALAQFILVIEKAKIRNVIKNDELEYLEEFSEVCHEFLRH